MCCIFGLYNYSGKPIKNLSTLTNCLAEQAIVRGTDAAGIAFNSKGNLTIHKEAKRADMIDFKHPDSVVAVMGHTRHSTQGSHKKNYNNHPFFGKVKNGKFALAHNGVLMNDKELKAKYKLPKNRIETDSFVAVQLIEKKNVLDSEAIRFMAENVEGSFSFTVLDNKNTLWLIKGDSPLSVIHFPKYKLYVYASTDEILYKALVDTKLLDEIKNGGFEEITITDGEIFEMKPDGSITRYKFDYRDYTGFGRCSWWDYGIYENKNAYIEDLKSVAVYQGYSTDEIDYLVKSGFSPEEIEEFIYCME